MDMSNSIMIAAPRTRVWDALNDPATLQRCIAGCESIEVTGDNAYKVAMTVAIGPVKAKFKGELMLEDIDAPNAYTIRFSGQGGMAGFGKGSARVTLSDAATGDISRDLAADGAGQGPHDAAAMQGGTRLDYTVDAQIGGKIAQVGSRLIDGASKKMADDFFKAFRREVEVPLPEKEISSATTAAPSPPLPTTAPSSPPATPAASSPTASPASSIAASTSGTTAASQAHADADEARLETAPTSVEAVADLMLQAVSHERWTWLAIAVAVAAAGLLMVKR